MGRKVSKWSQSVLCATVLGSESVYSWCDPVKRLEYWLAFMEELFFQVLKNLVAHGRHLGFDRNANGGSRSTNPENPTIKPNMK